MMPDDVIVWCRKARNWILNHAMHDDGELPYGVLVAIVYCLEVYFWHRYRYDLEPRFHEWMHQMGSQWWGGFVQIWSVLAVILAPAVVAGVVWFGLLVGAIFVLRGIKWFMEKAKAPDDDSSY